MRQFQNNSTTMAEEYYDVYNPWNFVHSAEFTTDIIIEEVQEIYSTGPPETEDGQVVEVDQTAVQYYSYSREEDDPDESDVHDQKFLVRFLATNTDQMNRYLWLTDDGEVRTDGGYSNLATFFEVIHWCGPHESYQLICQGGGCKGYILYMDGAMLKSRVYNAHTDDKDITTKFQMCPRGENSTVQGFISKTGVPIYFDSDGNYRPEGPSFPKGANSPDSAPSLQPLYFIASNVRVLKVSSV